MTDMQLTTTQQTQTDVADARQQTNTIVVGAGPYGLTAAAHLAHAGVPTMTFGRPLSFWKECMPEGMHLRSSWGASSIAHPEQRFSLDDHQARIDRKISKPIPGTEFIDYGEWFQQNAVPNVDERAVTLVSRSAGGFDVTLEDGEILHAKNVVMATGLAGTEWHPAPFDDLAPDRVTHAVEIRHPDRFANERVLVVGSGQSAVETAVLLHEAGAEVQILARRQAIHWLTRSGWLHKAPDWVQRMLYASTDVGPPGLSQIVARPALFRRLPERLRIPIAERSIRPAASGWLLPRSSGIATSEGERGVAANVIDGEVRVRTDKGREITVDHVVLGTGYRPQVSTQLLLDEQLRSVIAVDDEGLPVLKNGFMSSVPGLHFVGAMAAGTYGPLMRFVSGTPFAGKTIASAIGVS